MNACYPKSYLAILTIMVGSTTGHIAWAYLLIVWSNLGMLGVSISTLMTTFTLFSATGFYIWANEDDLEEATFWPTIDCLRGLWDHIRLSLVKMSSMLL